MSGEGFYPSPEWLVVVDEFLERGGRLEFVHPPTCEELVEAWSASALQTETGVLLRRWKSSMPFGEIVWFARGELFGADIMQFIRVGQEPRTVDLGTEDRSWAGPYPIGYRLTPLSP